METWKKQLEDKSMKVVLRREDPACLPKWIVDIDQIASNLW